MTPRIVTRKEVVKTPFFTLVAKSLSTDPNGTPHYAIETLDYVSVIPTTPEGDIILVRQFRPAVECIGLELPGGHVDPGEQPLEAARRELLEETGYQTETWVEVGCAKPDIGRLGNRLWVFLARKVTTQPNAPAPEPGLERVVISHSEFQAKLRSGEFDHALNLAALAMAQVRGLIPGLL